MTIRYSPISINYLASLEADYLSGMSFERLAGKYRSSVTMVQKALIGAGVPLRGKGAPRICIGKERKRGSRLSHQAKAKAQALYKNGEALAAIGKKLGVSAPTIRKALVEEGCSIKKRTKLPEDDWPIICSDYQRGLAAQEIAARYGADHQRVIRILRACGVEIRPRGGLHDTVQALLLGKGPFASAQVCFFYVYEIATDNRYLKPGIAFDVERRAEDRVYGQEIFRLEFVNRAEAYVFEQSFLAATKKHAECPGQLRLDGWAGYSEVRKLGNDDAIATAMFLANQLEELSMWEFAACYVPMTAAQRAACQQRAMAAPSMAASLQGS
jgi:hypothetical protein